MMGWRAARRLLRGQQSCVEGQLGASGRVWARGVGTDELEGQAQLLAMRVP